MKLNQTCDLGNLRWAVAAILMLVLTSCSEKTDPRIEGFDGRIFYVSLSGDDSNPGSKKQPFRTLLNASASTQPGDMVMVRGGAYSEPLAPLRSGEPDKPITFTAFQGETVSLVCGQGISGWQKSSKGVFVADCLVDLGLGQNQLVCDGELMIEARSPNIEHKDELIHAFGLGKTLRTISGDNTLRLSAAHPELQTSEPVHYIGRHGGAWGTQVALGIFDTAGKMTIAKRTDQGFLSWWQGKGEGFITGSRNDLDHEREWFLDREAGKLYFIPPSGIDLRSAHVYVKNRSVAIDLSGKQHIVVDGLDTLMGTVLMEDSESCVIRNGAFLYGGHHSFFENPYVYETDLAERTGVTISGRENRVERCEIAYNAGASVVMQGQSNQVVNCRIHDTGLLGSYYSGIYIGQKDKATGGGHQIGQNTIFNTGRGAINISSIGKWDDPGTFAHPMKIHHNHIANAMLICDDGGAIYQFCTDGGGSEIHNNWIFTSRGEQIYFDNHSVGWRVHHNVIGGKININFPSNRIHIYNNTLLKTRYSVPKYFYEESHFVSHNIDTFFQKENWVTCNGVRPTHVDFFGAGEAGLTYQVERIREGGLPIGTPRPTTVDGSTLPGFSPKYFGAYRSRGAHPWVAGCDWGGGVPRIPYATRAPLKIQASEFSENDSIHDNALFIHPTIDKAWARYDDIALSAGYSHVVFDVRVESDMAAATLELRLGSPTGKLLASTEVPYRPESHQFSLHVAPIKEVTGTHDVFLVVQAKGRVEIADFAFIGAGETETYSHHPRDLVHDGGTKITNTAYAAGRSVWLMADYDFKHPEIYLNGALELSGCQSGHWAFYPKVDFGEGRDHLMLNLGSNKYDDPNASIELRSGSPEGPLLGKLSIERIEEGTWREQRMDLQNARGIHDVFIVFPRNFTGGLNYIVL